MVPARIALTLSGNTHGGQVRVLGDSPVVPSDYGNRYAYGHVAEAGRHLVFPPASVPASSRFASVSRQRSFS